MSETPQIQIYFDDLRERAPFELGVSGWMHLDQPKNDIFGHLARDFQPAYSDPKWCSTQGYETVMHPFLLLSMHAALQLQLGMPIRTDEHATAANYGYEGIEWIEPIPTGTPVRMRVTVNEVEERRPLHYLVRMRFDYEAEGKSDPSVIVYGTQYYLPPEDGEALWARS